MHTFQRTTAELVKGIVLALFGTAAVCFVSGVFGLPLWVQATFTVAAALGLTWLFVISESLRVEVSGSGTLRQFCCGRLRRQVTLPDCSIDIKSRPGKWASRGVNLFILYFTCAKPAGSFQLDCSPLGKEQFEQLCELVSRYSRPQGKPEKATGAEAGADEDDEIELSATSPATMPQSVTAQPTTLPVCGNSINSIQE